MKLFTFLTFLLFTSALFSQEIVTVKNAVQLLNALESNTTISVDAEWIFLSEVSTKKSGDYYSFISNELVISGINNIKIQGGTKKRTKIITQDGNAYVLVFKNSNDIELDGLEIGHGPVKGTSCSAGVVKFDNCKNIEIQNSLLFGSGTEGLTCNEVNGLTIDNVEIRSCTNSIFSFRKSSNIELRNSLFTDNTCSSGFVLIEDCIDILIEGCEFSLNRMTKTDYSDTKRSLFNTKKSLNVKLVKSNVISNYADHLLFDKTTVDLEGCVIDKNKFNHGRFNE